MNRPLKVVVQGAVAALLFSATALPASAEYLGYGNGDPGNWDFWQEQNGGKAMPSEDQQQAMAQRHLYYNSMTGTYEGSHQKPHYSYHNTHRQEQKPG
jgi:hypothetical protein